LLSGDGRARHGEIMREATKQAEAGLLSALVDSRHFDQRSVDAAHALVASGQALGKVVVDVADI